jgi:BirA family biotin operon repressor/biotin-[acetyl-CoA-carboxylase] ligase
MNLLFSIVLYPGMVSPENQFIISMFISLGIRDFLITLIPECSIKWPNDIYSGDDKIAGILIENSVTGMEITYCVAGIGLNVNQTDFPGHIPNPVSIKMLTGNEHDPDLCLKQLAGFLDRRYKQLISGYSDDIRGEYITSLYRLNEWHRFRSEGGDFSGRIVTISDSGRLIVEKRDGKLHEFSFKEIDFSA